MGEIHRVKKGLKLPITGEPQQKIENGRQVRSVALVGFDYTDMKPTMKVNEGDKVKLGQTLFEDKRAPGVTYTAPASGTVRSINRGKRRVFQSLVIDVSGDDAVNFQSYKQKSPDDLSFDEVKDLLIESGQWTALRRRPFSKVANPEERPNAVFITAMDSNPLSAKAEIIIEERKEDFQAGVKVLSKLTEGPTFVCQYADEQIPVNADTSSNIHVEKFQGKHPAGNVGFHVNQLMKAPVSLNNIVWYVGYQDVLLIGHLFRTGKLNTERVIAVGGPEAKNPRLLRTRVGACLSELLDGEKSGEKVRVISGSALYGRKSDGPFDYLGRYTNQVTLLEEGGERELLGWHAPGFDKFSVKPTFVSRLMPGKKFRLNTLKNGSDRAMVPVGTFEKVMPFRDMLPTQLLRAIVTKDTELAQSLGVLELDEEDLALCTFASPGKTDFGPYLRESLTLIEKEG